MSKQKISVSIDDALNTEGMPGTYDCPICGGYTDKKDIEHFVKHITKQLLVQRADNEDQTEGYALITRLIETRNLLTMAAQSIEYSGYQHGHRAIDELDQAMVHITLAIEAL